MHEKPLRIVSEEQKRKMYLRDEQDALNGLMLQHSRGEVTQKEVDEQALLVEAAEKHYRELVGPASLEIR